MNYYIKLCLIIVDFGTLLKQEMNMVKLRDNDIEEFNIIFYLLCVCVHHVHCIYKQAVKRKRLVIRADSAPRVESPAI